MNLRFSFVSTAVAAFLLAAGSVYGQSATQTEHVTLSEKVKIPGATLKAGEYTFAVEDRLQDRAIVRITSGDQNKHFLVLTVPSANLGQPASDGLIRFKSNNGKDEALRGWACSGCTPALEFVYPKAEAAKLTDETAESVLAVDPTYDKLPPNLTPDDMKVVTLWLLSPERLTASNKGKGVKAEKYASVSKPAAQTDAASVNASEVAQTPAPPVVHAPVAQVTAPASTPAATTSNSTSELAQVPAPAATPAAPAPAAQPTELASAAVPAHSGRLPKTASNDYVYVFGGLLLLLGAGGLRLSRKLAFSRSDRSAASGSLDSIDRRG